MRRKIRNPKAGKRVRRHMSIRNKITGTPERPRVCVYRSTDHIYAQLIDDTAGKTLCSVSSLKLDRKSLLEAKPKEAEGGEEKKAKKGKKKKKQEAGKVLLAREVGRMLAEVAKEKGITKIAFDRGGYLYHGRVAALASAARENGLEF